MTAGRGGSWLVMAAAVLWLGPVAFGAARKTVKVAADGSGEYRTVQAAVDAAPGEGSVIEIAPGTYREKLNIAGNHIELRGTGARPQEVVLSYDDDHAMAGGTGKSASVTVTGDDFAAENLTIQNDWEQKHARLQEGSQAVALLISGDREVLRHVRLLGYQDTLYANSKTCHAASDPQDVVCHASRQLFEDCYIEGHVDFIFGDAKAAFVRCEIHAKRNPLVTLTAQSRLYAKEDSGYLFRDCTITADEGVGRLLLGRPWRAYSTVYFIDTRLNGAKLDPQGWSDWDGKLATSTYAEYKTGPGSDVTGRIAGTQQLTQSQADKLTVRGWLAGSDGWDPQRFR